MILQIEEQKETQISRRESVAIDEAKALKEENEALKAKLKEKDKLIKHLVKA